MEIKFNKAQVTMKINPKLQLIKLIFQYKDAGTGTYSITITNLGKAKTEKP
ncbi:hypothetical protein Hanom_Chr03g00240951 [Helianthus anomalus]